MNTVVILDYVEGEITPVAVYLVETDDTRLDIMNKSKVLMEDDMSLEEALEHLEYRFSKVKDYLVCNPYDGLDTI